MSSGLPVIASNLPGVRKVFEDRKQGFLVKPGDPDDLKLKIEELLKNEKLRAEMSKNSLYLIKEKYDWSLVGQRLCRAIDNLINT
jgi:glycosyltransferase involved in cell wall biosynthesis